ncbi:hypothetical protein [Streptomyces pseudovenezuelae]|uniref:Integral membrane protein n=1 Tax=Streptomyces pseudovenezuelae TaxID=67350 RepID=A0ABT6LSH2_9ACTN|nr:hypothetical protein [Streptomyces pseudovenezuelae]MDH6219277.1 hypothetical protein [Streptomyces pseudovenezuelae]
MLALRLSRGAHPAVQLRRLLVAVASAGTGFLFLCTLGYAMSHPDNAGASLLRLAWCLTPLAATVHFAVAVARTDPGTRPRPGLAAIGLGPARLMAVSALTTALSCLLGSMLALLFFLHLRGDLTGMPFDGAAAQFLAADSPLPLPAALTLLALVPAIASTTVALVLRPRDVRPPQERVAGRSYGRFGAYGRSADRETFGAYGRFGARLRTQSAGSRAAGAAPVPQRDGTPQARASEADSPAEAAAAADGTTEAPAPAPASSPAPRTAPVGLPWGIAILAAGLAVEAYASRTTPTPRLALPGGLTTGTPAILAGFALAALGLALAAPGLTHLCGRLLQSARPGALRLLAGRVLMEEATRIGRPLGIVCAVAAGAYAMTALYDTGGPDFGPLTTLGTLLVTGCTVATLLTAAVEAKHARAETTAALVRLGAPATMLRSAAAIRAGALLALFVPLTLVVAELAALPLTR